MRALVSVFLLFCSIGAFSAPYESLIKEIESGELSIATIADLVDLDESLSGVGYGLCMSSGRKVCEYTGTLGYGLCMVAGRKKCDYQGTLGYGLCMASGREICDYSGTLGYGLCMASKRKNCDYIARED